FAVGLAGGFVAREPVQGQPAKGDLKLPAAAAKDAEAAAYAGTGGEFDVRRVDEQRRPEFEARMALAEEVTHRLGAERVEGAPMRVDDDLFSERRVVAGADNPRRRARAGTAPGHRQRSVRGDDDERDSSDSRRERRSSAPLPA